MCTCKNTSQDLGKHEMITPALPRQLLLLSSPRFTTRAAKAHGRASAASLQRSSPLALQDSNRPISVNRVWD